MLNGGNSPIYPTKASVPQGSVFGPILWNIFFNDLLQSFPAESAYSEECTLFCSYNREEAINVVDAINCHIGSIMAWGKKRQVQFAAVKTEAVLITQ